MNPRQALKVQQDAWDQLVDALPSLTAEINPETATAARQVHGFATKVLIAFKAWQEVARALGYDPDAEADQPKR